MVELRIGRYGPRAAERRRSPKGMTRVAVTAVVDAAGSHVLQAAVTMPADPLAVNNTLDREAWVAPRAKVLYVEGAAGQRALPVTARSPDPASTCPCARPRACRRRPRSSTRSTSSC